MVAAVASELPIWSDAKYESFFFELLKGVCEQGWDRDAVLSHLAKREGDNRLILWLKRFGVDRLADAMRHEELAERMGKLGDVDDGEFCREVKRIAEDLSDRLMVIIPIAFSSQSQIVEDASSVEMLESFDRKDIQKGIELCRLGRYIESLDFFDEILQIEPNNCIVLNGRGIVLYELGRYEEAISSYDRALSIEPIWYLRKL